MQCFCVTLFPSPIGELHFSIRIVNHLQVQNVFPSPIGELHFSIITGKNEKELFTPVSVPYRGATFLNRNKNIVGNSVRGFPSPIGELHFSIVRWFLTVNADSSFRPLSGSYISQLSTMLDSQISGVSVPYRGATFLNTISATPCPVWDE